MSRAVFFDSQVDFLGWGSREGCSARRYQHLQRLRSRWLEAVFSSFLSRVGPNHRRYSGSWEASER